MALFVYPPTTISTSGLATEAKQDVIITELQEIEADIEAGNVTLSNIETNTNDVATETTLATKASEATLATKASETTLATRASETTLASLNSKVTVADTDNVTISSALPAGTNNIGDVDVVSSALPTGAATSSNQSTIITSLSNIETDVDELNARLAGNLVPEQFDYVAISYVAAGNGIGEIETVTYRTGGAAGTIQATLTLAYDGSNRLSAVTRS